MKSLRFVAKEIKTEPSSKGLGGGIVGIIFIATPLYRILLLLPMIGEKYNDWVKADVSFPMSSYCVFVLPWTVNNFFYKDIPKLLADLDISTLRLEF